MCRTTAGWAVAWALGTLLTIGSATAQTADATIEAPPSGHHEAPDNPPALPGRQRLAVTPRAVIALGPYISVQVNVNAAGQNIIGDAANEPSIAVDPNDPDRVAIGWRQFDSTLSNFRQAGWAFSQDGGFSWTFPGALQAGIFRSDPVLDYDAEGRFYYNSLRGDFACQYFISDDGGQNWAAPVEAYGGDKQWSAIDRSGGIGHGNIYVAWSPAAGCCGNRLFTRSTDGGATFMDPIALPVSPMWGTLTVAPNGSLFISGRASGGLVPVQRSMSAQNAGATPVFEFSTFVPMGGNTPFAGSPNPGGLLGQVWIACEPAGGPRPNNVYLLASVDPPGIDPLDVMFVRSTNGGLTWEQPVRINDDAAGNGAYQWFGTMSVAPNGRIDAIWNDTRDQPSNQMSQLYFSTSRDGGTTWSANVAVSPAFNPAIGYPNQNKLGDYYHTISHNGYVHVAYAATFTGGQDVYYLRIPIDCNENGVEDADDIAAGTSLDCNTNGLPDECDWDCDDSGVVDECELAAGSVPDCDRNDLPDSCDLAAGRLPDCDGSGVPDPCELAAGSVPDCNVNGIPDGCDITSGYDDDCDGNDVPDECDSAALSTLIQAPLPALACVGAEAHFSVSAAGATGFQWRVGDQAIPQATSSELIVGSIALEDEGPYSCVVSFGCIHAESPSAMLHVVPPQVSIELLSAPSIQVCSQGGATDLALVVGVDDIDGVLYQWSREGVDLVDGGRISGAQAALLNIAGLQPTDAGEYACRVWNICIEAGEAVSVGATVEVIDAVFSEPSAHACAELGGIATFNAEVQTGSPQPLIFRWYEGAALLADGGRLSGTTTTTLQLSGIVPADGGRRFRLRAIVPDPLCSSYSREAVVLVQSPGGCTICPTPGDLDADGDYDLLDAHRFGLCFGADVGMQPDCRCANVRGDNPMVDIDDWRLLEQILDGPQGP